MSTLTLSAENPELLLKVQTVLQQFPEIIQKESADLRKARAKAEFKAMLQEAADELHAMQRGEIEGFSLEEVLAELRKDRK